MGAWCINPKLLPDNMHQHFLGVQFKQVKTSNPQLSLETVQLHLHTTKHGLISLPDYWARPLFVLVGIHIYRSANLQKASSSHSDCELGTAI